MKKTSTKLAALGASAVVVALVAAAIAFNLFIGWKVEAEAVGDIEYALELNENAATTGRTPNSLLLDSSYRIDPSERRWSTEDEKKLAAWFAEHPEEGKVSRVTLDNWTCYAAIVSRTEYDLYYDTPHGEGYYYSYDSYPDQGGYIVEYIDTTSEQSLIATVNTAFVIIGIIGALLAAAAGYVAGRRIDEAQEAQKRFYENMSHDLKTPLAAIRGYAEGASGGIVSVDEATRSIVRETDRMTETINEILGLSRLEAGAVQPNKEAIVVEDFVQDCLMPLEGAVRTRGIEVELDLAPGEVMADSSLFDHALSNVLTNAVRHAGTRIRVTYDGTRLAVWNDGGAPEAEQLSHLFDRFHAGEGGSTGIGLAIAKEVANLHGWSIAARRVDDGLEIAFTF